jgi:transposase-like protein
MDVQITKDQAIAAYGGNASALARALGITPQAVYQWDDGPIDEGHALKLRFVLKPEVFAPARKGRKAA